MFEDKLMQSCGFEESTHARYIPFEMEASYALYLFCSKRVSKAKAIYLMHTGISGLATKIILFDAHQRP